MTFRERKGAVGVAGVGFDRHIGSSGCGSNRFIGSDPPLIIFNVDGTVTPIISVGEEVDDVEFEGIRDGIGIVDGPSPGTVDVFVAHEQSTVPFQGARDFEDASVTKWTIDTATNHVLNGDLAISPDLGYLRFCSAAIVGPEHGFSTRCFGPTRRRTTSSTFRVGAPYGPDPAIAPQRQGGYAVALDTSTLESAPVAGLGRLNHENTVGLAGHNQIALLTTNDTFTATTSQLYMYLANHESHVWDDKGSLGAFRVTAKNSEPVDPADPFNEAGDYLALGLDDGMQGRLIRVPREIARGTTDEALQDALENWSIENNVFTFVRLEDVAVDKNDERVVYVADT